MQILACHAEVDHVSLSEVIIFCDKESLDYIKDHVGVTAQKIMSSQVFAIRDAKRAGAVGPCLSITTIKTKEIQEGNYRYYVHFFISPIYRHVTS
jgi:hypothetical protein